MINESLIKSSLFGLVGFRNSTISGYDIVNSDNQGSTSGLYFQDGCNLVTIKNIKETQENPSITDVAFNTLLEQLQERAIIDTAYRIVSEESKFLESKTLLPFEQKYDETEVLTKDFVGIKISPCLNQRILLNINTLSVAFDSDQDITIYLYSSDRKTELESTIISALAGETVTKSVNWKITLNTTTSLGGSYYIGYKTNEIGTSKPLKRNYENSSYALHSNWFNFEFAEYDELNELIIPSNQNAITDPYGLNMNYSVYNDYTDLIEKNKHLFARPIQLQMASIVIEQILTSTRTNLTERLSKDIRNIANFVLNDDNTGIRKRIDMDIKNLKDTLFPKTKIVTATLR